MPQTTPKPKRRFSLSGRRMSGMATDDAALVTGQEVLTLCEWGDKLAAVLDQNSWGHVLVNDGIDLVVFQRQSPQNRDVHGIIAPPDSDEPELLRELQEFSENGEF